MIEKWIKDLILQRDDVITARYKNGNQMLKAETEERRARLLSERKEIEKKLLAINSKLGI